MNRKFIGATVLTVAAVGGYLYYQHHKAQVDKILQLVEEKIQDAFLNAFLAPGSYPETDPEEDKVHG